MACPRNVFYCKLTYPLFFPVRNKSIRHKWSPSRHYIFWDMNIPTEYYKEDFIDFENYLQETGQNVESSSSNPHANSDYHLEKYASYEKWRKRENLKLIRKQKRLKANKEKLVANKNQAMDIDNVMASENVEINDSCQNLDPKSAEVHQVCTFITFPSPPQTNDILN